MGSSNQWRAGHQVVLFIPLVYICGPWTYSSMGLGAELNGCTHCHHMQSAQEAIQTHKHQRRLEIPLLDFLILFEVSMEILPSVLKLLLEEAQGIWDHLQFSLTFFHLDSQEVFWTKVIRGLKCKQISVTESGCRHRVSHNLVDTNSELHNCPVDFTSTIWETSDPSFSSTGGLDLGLSQRVFVTVQSQWFDLITVTDQVTCQARRHMVLLRAGWG